MFSNFSERETCLIVGGERDERNQRGGEARPKQPVSGACEMYSITIAARSRPVLRVLKADTSDVQWLEMHPKLHGM